MPPHPDPPEELLHSWKEIAAALGITVRTAQRWEQERGLPVRRSAGSKGRLVADSKELAEWKKNQAQEPAWWADTRYLQYYAAASSALLLVLLGGYFFSSRKGPPASVRPEYKSLVVSDGSGRELWRRSFPDAMGAEGYYSEMAGRTSWIGNLDGDPGQEVVFSYLPVNAEKTGTALYCFSSSGREKWKFTPGKVVSDSEATYPPNYIITDMMVWNAGPGAGYRIAVAGSHSIDYPCQIAVLDGSGKLLGEYWHSGHLDALELADIDGDGAVEILAAGCNNGYRAAVLVVLDPGHVSGASQQEPGSRYQIKGFPAASEKAVVVFPRTCINRLLGLYNQAKHVRFADGALTVRVQETGNDYMGAVFYTLDRNLGVTRVEVSDTLKALHRRLEGEGKLQHEVTAAEIEQLRKLTRTRFRQPVR